MSDQPPQKPPAGNPNLQVQIDEDVAGGIYSNLVLINHTENEFFLDFAFVSPGAPRAKIRARVISSPRHAKRFVRALAKNLERYEERHGEIDLSDEDGPSVH